MTTARQIEANRENAKKSTGPRTAHGKAIASRNNTRHGFRSSSPVIRRLENPDAWEQHRATTVAGLNPGSPLEEALAERVALILWRLDRVARYERHVTTRSQERAPADVTAHQSSADGANQSDQDCVEVRERFAEARHRLRALTRLAQLRPDAPIPGRDAEAILVAIGEEIDGFDVYTFSAPEIIPDDVNYFAFTDWTVERLTHLLEAIAAQHGDGRSGDQLRDLRRERILPQPPNLEQVIRYETHLMRQLSQTLSHLKQLQHARPTTPSAPTDLPLSHLRERGSQAGTAVVLPLALARERGPGGTESGFKEALEGCHSNPIPGPLPPSQPETAEGAEPPGASSEPQSVPAVPQDPFSDLCLTPSTQTWIQSPAETEVTNGHDGVAAQKRSEP
jgi:hypothetical protein